MPPIASGVEPDAQTMLFSSRGSADSERAMSKCFRRIS